eukprot:3530405-Pyramimonas_sp.AAC.1
MPEGRPCIANLVVDFRAVEEAGQKQCASKLNLDFDACLSRTWLMRAHRAPPRPLVPARQPDPSSK